MPQSDRESRLNPLVGRPLRLARRAVAYALKHEFQQQLDEMRALILESNAYTSRQLLDVQAAVLGKAEGDGVIQDARLAARQLSVVYAARAASGLEAGVRILDVAPGSTSLAYALASLGYAVWAASGVEIGYKHPNLTFVAPDAGQLNGEFGAVLAVLPADPDALRLIPGLTKPGTLLVAAAEVPSTDGLDRILPIGSRPPAGWHVEDRTVLEAGHDGSWTPVDRVKRGQSGLVLVTARAV